MKSFKKFIFESVEILEKYYPPDEKLPSGITPKRKAIRKAITRHYTPNKSDSEKGRHEVHKEKIRTHVRHGADNEIVNPYVSKKDKSEIKTTVNREDGWTDVHHKKSGVTYHVRNHNNKAYEVHWSHNKDKSKMKSQEKVATGVSAAKVFHKHVLPRLRNNRTIITHATGDESAKKKDKKGTNPQTTPNKRAEIYKRSGFSNRDASGNIAGKVERRRGQTRVIPRPPIKGRIRSKLYSNDVRNNPRNFAADYDPKTEKSGKKPKDNKVTTPRPRFQPFASYNYYHINHNPSRKRQKGYSGNVARNNPISLNDLKWERDARDFRSEH